MPFSLYDGPNTPKKTEFPSKDARLPLERSVNVNVVRKGVGKVEVPAGPRSV